MARPGRLKLKFTDDAGREERRRIQVSELKLNFTDHSGRNHIIDLSRLGDRPALARSIVTALTGLCEPDGTVKSLATVTSYVTLVKSYLWTFLAYHEEDGHPIYDSKDINTATLRSFIDWLRLNVPKERSAYSYYLTISRLLTYLRVNYPELVDSRLEIPLYPGRGLDRSIVHRQPYSPREASQIVKGAQSDVRRMIARFRRGTQLLSTGTDPRIGRRKGDADRSSPWACEGNVLWYIKNVLGGAYLTERDLTEGGHLSFMWGAFGGRHKRAEIYGYIYPLVPDLVPLILLLALGTGLNPQTILDLRRDCLKSVPAPGQIGIRCTKNRPRAKVFRKIVDNRSLLSPGGIIRLTLKITEPCLPYLPEDLRDYLFVGLLCGPSSSGFRRPHDCKSIECHVLKFANRHSLKADDDQPLRLNLSRLRSTYLTKRYKAAGNIAAVMKEAEHKQEHTTRGYIDNAQVRSVHEQTVADGLEDFYKAVTGVVLNQSAEDPDQVALAASLIGVTPSGAESILRGEQDVFIAACKDFYNRPGGMVDTPCDRPWACFTCKNACWTSGTLPRLCRFYDFIIEQRSLLTAKDWEAKFGVPYAVITEHILPAFPPETVAAARAAPPDDLVIPISLKTV